ncbi:MAG: glycine--tRNA ligase subunit beta [Alphaproteobacteria bacterium]
MAELLLELFSEEIPARMQARASDDLKRLVTEALKDAGLTFDKAEAFATPRRLALVVDGLPLAQPDVREERRGPKVDAPDKAVEGFLKSVGLTRDQVTEVEDKKKGRHLLAVIEREGRPTAEVIAEIVPTVIRSFPWPKSMRWGDGVLTWVRPLHSILCVLDGVPVTFDVDGVEAGATTAGHRFMALEPFEVSEFADYQAKLRDAKVVLDPRERKLDITEQLDLYAQENGLIPIEDDGLINEVAGLVEWPVVLFGAFDPAFLKVPEEALISAIRTHQKYPMFRDRASGTLAPKFAVVANLEAKDGGAAIVAGNERVLSARLADTKFFWDQDLKAGLASRVPALNEIVFHEKLGTLGDKVDRVGALAVELCHYVPGADRNLVRSAARLAKADLTAEMVGEFPDLQGVMGRYYALADGEDTAVADAIADHYRPQGPGDACPTAPVSVAVALADKIDTLVGFFGIDEKPTGSKDPFALRRAALGVIRLILENKLRLPLTEAIEKSEFFYEEMVSGRVGVFSPEPLVAFFADRLKVHLREQGVRHDLITAVFALSGEDDLVRLLARVKALQSFLETDDGTNLQAAYKRATNIVRIEEKKDDASYAGAVDPALLEQGEEKALADQLARATEGASATIADERFADAMSALAKLRGPVDAFFDEVTVNCDDPDVRRNRLHLLSQIRATLDQVADFSKIEGAT